MNVLLALLAAVSLSPPFVSAEARAVDTSEGVTIEVDVVVEAPAAAVLVRGVGLTQELDPVALADVGEGRWSGRLTLPQPENIRVTFELIPAGGGSSVFSSDLFTLTDLGVDPAFLGVSSATSATTAAEPADVRFDNESRRWGWLALAAGAGGLALLAVWVVGDLRQRTGANGKPEDSELEVGDPEEADLEEADLEEAE